MFIYWYNREIVRRQLFEYDGLLSAICRYTTNMERKGTDVIEPLDFRKTCPDLARRKTPMCIDVPAMTFLAVEGQGAPQGEHYQRALQAIYSIAFTIKMSPKTGHELPGYRPYRVPPLEGLWWCGDGALDVHAPRETWKWISLMRQPDFVTPAVFDWAVETCQAKKKQVDLCGIQLWTMQEGLCVQCLHVGPYDAEHETIARMHAFMQEQGLHDVSGAVRKHHEIYFSDPRRSAPEKWQTLLRLPVARTK